jgi:undecaprenyl-diphosphatase
MNVLYSTLRFIARHVRGFWGALLAFLTIGVVLGAFATTVFVLLAEAVRGGFTQAFDEGVLQWLAARRSPWLDKAMLEITTMGSGLPLIIFVTIAALFLWLSRHHWSVYFLVLGTLGGQVLNRLLKAYFERPRPNVQLWEQQVDSFSFPSGHAMSSFVAFGIVAYLVANAVSTRALERFVWITAAVLITLVGVSRMYLGVHYPSDVLAGFLAGLAWILFVAASMTALRFFAPRRPETRKEEEGLQATSTAETDARAERPA